MLPIDLAFREVAIDEIRALEKRLGALDVQRESVLRELAAWRVLNKAKAGDTLEHMIDSSSTSTSAERGKTPSEATGELINSFGMKGITPKELTQALRNLGHNVSDNFASRTLSRMKQNAEVIAYRRRFYLVRFAPAASRRA